jgi:hypothetical protein
MWLSHRCPGSQSRCRSAGMSKPCGRGHGLREQRLGAGAGAHWPYSGRGGRYAHGAGFHVFRPVKAGITCSWCRWPVWVGSVVRAPRLQKEPPFHARRLPPEERRRVVVVVVVVVHVAVALAEQDHSGHGHGHDHGHDLRAELLGVGVGARGNTA